MEILPARLDGKTVLDLGGYDGSMASACLQRGAVRATVVDSEQWRHYGWPEPERKPDVEYVQADFLYWPEAADVVLFLNVIYHQRNPWAALEKVRSLTRELLVLKTSFIPGDQPYWLVYEPYEGHPVSWTVSWRPMVPGLVKLLKNVGFRRIEEVGREGDHVVFHCA